MKKTRWIAIAVTALLMAAPVLEAQAKRLGGGTSVGRVAPSSGTKSTTPAKPAQPQQAAPAPAPTPQPAPKSSWMGPLAGLAAGLGLAALAAYLGLGEEFMSLMIILLAVVAGFAVVRYLAARRQAQLQAQGGYSEPAMAKTGYGSGNGLDDAAPVADNAWPGAGAQTAGAGSANQAVPATQPAAEISQDEVDQFMNVAREQFTQLQATWDSGDIHALAEFCTPAMTRELSHQIADRKGQVNVTQVVRLDAQWLGLSESLDDFGKPVDEVQVRFSGLIREGTDEAAVDFNEIWLLHRPKSASSGWLLAGITQLQ